MALPHIIANGQTPSGTKLQEILTYLDTKTSFAIKLGTYEEHKADAVLSPSVLFLCWATDHNLFLLYCGNTAVGDEGFLTIASGQEIS